MDFQHTSCKPTFGQSAKCLKNGADWGLRSPDPLITKHVAGLKTNGFSVESAHDAPILFRHLPIACKPSVPEITRLTRDAL